MVDKWQLLMTDFALIAASDGQQGQKVLDTFTVQFASYYLFSFIAGVNRKPSGFQITQMVFQLLL